MCLDFLHPDGHSWPKQEQKTQNSAAAARNQGKTRTFVNPVSPRPNVRHVFDAPLSPGTHDSSQNSLGSGRLPVLLYQDAWRGAEHALPRQHSALEQRHAPARFLLAKSQLIR